VPSTFDQSALGNATAALSGLEVYTSPAIPNWNPSILVASLTSGVIFRISLGAIAEAPITYFKSPDRYRDLAVSADGRRIYAVTAVRGRTTTATGQLTSELAHPGSLIEFSYEKPPR
jgi:hypothetical protein